MVKGHAGVAENKTHIERAGKALLGVTTTGSTLREASAPGVRTQQERYSGYQALGSRGGARGCRPSPGRPASEGCIHLPGKGTILSFPSAPPGPLLRPTFLFTHSGPRFIFGPERLSSSLSVATCQSHALATPGERRTERI